MKKAMMIVAMVGVIAMANSARAAMDDGLWLYPDPPAATKTWVGGSGTAWETPANWSGSTLPGSTDDVEISGATVDSSSSILVGWTSGNHCQSLVLNNAILPLGAGSYGVPLQRSPGPGPQGSLWMTGASSITAAGQGWAHVGTSSDYYQISGSFQGDYIYMQQRSPGIALAQIMGGSFELTGPSHNGWNCALMMSAEEGGAVGDFRVYGSASGGGPTSVQVESMQLGNPWYTGGQAHLEFGMDAGGVTPIQVTGDRQTYFEYHPTHPLNSVCYVDGSSQLALDWSGLGGPIGDITLIDIVQSGSAYTNINGQFGNAPEGTTYEPWGAGNGLYSLTYTGGDGSNDLVLEYQAPPIPEPAGLGLLGVALLAVRRRRS